MDNPKELIERGFFPVMIDLTEEAWAAIERSQPKTTGIDNLFWLRTQPRIGESFLLSTGPDTYNQKLWRGQIIDVIHIPYKAAIIEDDDTQTEADFLALLVLGILIDNISPAGDPYESSPWNSK